MGAPPGTLQWDLQIQPLPVGKKAWTPSAGSCPLGQTRLSSLEGFLEVGAQRRRRSEKAAAGHRPRWTQDGGTVGVEARGSRVRGPREQMSKNSEAGVTGPAGQDKPSLLGLVAGGGVSVSRWGHSETTNRAQIQDVHPDHVVPVSLRVPPAPSPKPGS